MCKVYEFPTKKELSDVLKKRMDKITKEYVNIMNETLENLYGENLSASDYEEFQEVILVAFLESLEKAIDELD
jgi:DNA-binding ferritin-like protein (Dps family)